MEVLGIDIGGSGIKAAIVDTSQGTLLSDRIRIDTPRPRTPAAIADVIKDIKAYFKWNDEIGCAFPTVVRNGKAKYSSNLHESWKGVQIDEYFSQFCDNVNFEVINDADAAGIAEMRFGAGRGMEGLVIVITIGTGLGSGMFYNGQLIPNTELGRMPGKDGEAIEKYAADSARKREDLTFDKWGKRLDFFLKHVVRVFSPDHIILGGGASKKIDKYKDKITISTPYSVSETLNNAGIIGAAVNAAEHHRQER